MNLSENIYRLRTEKRMSQTDLAEALEVSRQSVSKWETGSATPELDKLMKMANLFDVSLDELVGHPIPDADTTDQNRDFGLSLPRISATRLLGILLVFLGGLAVILGLALEVRAADSLLLWGGCAVLCGLFCLFLPYPQLFCGWGIWSGLCLHSFLLTAQWEQELYPLLLAGLSLIAMITWTLWAHTAKRVTIPNVVWAVGGLTLTALLILLLINTVPPFFIGVTEESATRVP